METKIGTVETIIYKNNENGYSVISFTDDDGVEFTAVGALSYASKGEKLELTGSWKAHKRFGSQFFVQASKTVAPSSLTDLISYLGSGLIKGVGLPTAKKIVQFFGMDTLAVMDNEPSRLAEIPGIGKMKASVIGASFSEQKEMRDIMLALQKYGVTISQSYKLYKLYGALCISKINENPYRLIDDVENIGFKTADMIAKNAGISEDSEFRIKAGIKYMLRLASFEGHTFLPYELLASTVAELLAIDIIPAERSINELIIESTLVRKLIDNTDAVFLPYLFQTEMQCAKKLVELTGAQIQSFIFSADAEINELERKNKVQLAAKQRGAIKTALRSSAMVITGGPGTGKTTILRFIISIFDKYGISYDLCAPTGRAAKRMSEATGCEARTMHRMLEYSYSQPGFIRNEENPLDSDVIIIDEMSMVDIPLMLSTLKAMNKGARLIMVGDSDQLPSVGVGNVLKDVIDTGLVPTVKLDEIFRQGERSMIVTNAHRINNGQMPIIDENADDFIFEEFSYADEVLARVVALASGKSKKLGAVDPQNDIQVLVPAKKGVIGVHNLNAKLQAAINPPSCDKKERRYSESVTYREGDKVMQIKNNYDLSWTRKTLHNLTEDGSGVFNGDIGTIMHIDDSAHCVFVLFDDERYARYEFTQLDEITLAYCVSIHKSQGSEFPIVLLPLVTAPPMLLTRNLLYTAVTRARRQVCIVGFSETVKRMVSNNQIRRRYSGLSFMMTEYRQILDDML